MTGGGADGLHLEPVRIAVVGLGYWGPNLVRNLHELPEAEVVAVCDAREERLDAIRARYPAIVGMARFADVIADDSIEAVALATPVSTHFELAASAIAAGKHVFVEKPLAASSSEALELLDRAERAGVVLMPGHTFIYSPPVNTVQRLIRAGELGEIYFVSMSRVNLGLHQSDVSVAWDLGPHDFSILRYWLGEVPTHVSALSRSCILPHTADVAFINLEFSTATIAHVELAWLAPSKLRRTTIVGSERMITYDDTSNEPVRVFESGVLVETPGTFGEYRLTYRTGDIVSPHVPVAEPIALEMADFCESVRTGTTPRSSPALGLDVVRVIEAVEASLGANGARMEVGHALAAA